MKKNILPIVLIIALTALAFCTYFASYSENIAEGLGKNIIRLHVRANSNSKEDQALKLNVKDTIVKYMGEKLKDSKSVDESAHIMNVNMNNIEKLVKEEILIFGKEYPAKIVLEEHPFPTKSYGDIVLPAGIYKALDISIGNGAGENWWCVLFPPLCVVDVTHGAVPDSVKEDLKNVLTGEEYKLITSGDDTEIPIKIKFKIVEIFQNSKIKFSGLISRILQ